MLYGATWQGGFAHAATATLTQAGDFCLVLPAPAAGVLHYAQGYAPLALVPSDAVQLGFDAARPDQTLRFAGRGGQYLPHPGLPAKQPRRRSRPPAAQAGRVGAAQLRRLAAAYRQRHRAALARFAHAHIAHDLHAAMRAHQRFASGQPASAFALPDAAGRLVTLGELRGKVVYLDFWASWCSPCLAEMPASNALRRQFAGRDVVFVYVSLDRQPAAWQQAVAARQLAGPTSVHLRADQEFASAVAQAYAVQSIPSYWLIGPDERLLRKDAPRPSKGARTVAALEAALQQ